MKPHPVQRSRPPAAKGSQHWLQHLVNNRPAALDQPLALALNLTQADKIYWHSPLRTDGYAEYRDGAFLSRLGVQLDVQPLASFWPARGPVWDGLATTSHRDLLLVEAKSHLAELRSPSTRATGVSRERIQASLTTTRRYLGVAPDVDWTSTYFQYTNRLAQYLLKKAG